LACPSFSREPRALDESAKARFHRLVNISQLIERLAELRAEMGDCPVTAAAMGMRAEFVVVDVVPGEAERSDTAHKPELPQRVVIALSLD
jgi:hypothetical protein